MGRMNGKVALITGAGTGIGRATAGRLADEGAKVVVTDIDGAAAESCAATIGDAASAFKLDVRVEAEWEAAMEHAVATFGGLDVLVNNAGILGTSSVQGPESTTLEEWRAVTEINLDGVFLGCRYAIPLMRARGGGAIVNLSSIAALLGTPHLSAYGATKSAVRQYTKSVALHCGQNGDNIRCNSVHPGLIETDMGARLLGWNAPSVEEGRSAREDFVPLGRLGHVDDVAQAILFLASDEASYITGTELIVDGGHMLK